MTTITNAGIITSFGRTPQAADDLFTSAFTRLTEDSGTFILDVMANDLGGNAKTLWSLDDGNSAATSPISSTNSPKEPYAPKDLLTKDAVGATELSKSGATIGITADGKVSYKMTEASKAQFQSLGAGEIGTDTFTYAIRLANGTLSWATASVQIAGVNDVPTVIGFTNGAVTEDALVTVGNLTSSGMITFDDVDLTDGHTTSVAAVTGNKLGGVLTASVTDTATGAGDGTVTWTYAVANSATQSLGEGQIATERFTVTIDDGKGGTIGRDITITITGTNDAPVAVADTNSGNEDSSITGTVANDTDVDNGAVLSYSLNAPVAGLTLNANGSYSFNAGNAAYQSLAKDATLDVVANYTVTDEFGATSTSTLTITLTGTDEPPTQGSGGGGNKANNGLGNGDQTAPGGSLENNGAENDQTPDGGSSGNNGGGSNLNNGKGNGDQDAPGGSEFTNNAENAGGNQTTTSSVGPAVATVFEINVKTDGSVGTTTFHRTDAAGKVTIKGFDGNDRLDVPTNWSLTTMATQDLDGNANDYVKLSFSDVGGVSTNDYEITLTGISSFNASEQLG